jgi:hypothetical protein
MSAGSKKDKDGKDFDYNKYSKDNHLDSLSEVSDFANDHHLFMRNMQTKVQLTIYNTGSHFSEDKYHLAIMYGCLFVLFAALAFINWKKYEEDRDRFEEEDSPLWFTFTSLNMIVAHTFMKCQHNLYYSMDGIGSMLCEMFAHIMLVFSRITMITILIAFAFGW